MLAYLVIQFQAQCPSTENLNASYPISTVPLQFSSGVPLASERLCIKGPSTWKLSRNLSKIGFIDSKKQSYTIGSGDVSKVIIHLYLAFLAMFLSESGNFLKYSFNSGNCFLTLSNAGIRESHLDCTCCKKTNSSRFSFCCTSA